MAKQATVSITVWWTLRTPMPTETKPRAPPPVRHRGQGPVLQFGDPGAGIHLGALPFKTDKD